MMIVFALGSLVLVPYLYWRFIWFYRNPSRTVPPGESIISPADGTVVYVKEVPPDEEVIAIKKGIQASINDIVCEDLVHPKVLIGIFMSPFNVHYNRLPLAGQIDFIRHYPAKPRNTHMGPMHLRSLLKRAPHYTNSMHIVQNERTVTRLSGRFKGESLSCYIVQIAGRSVSGIDSYVAEGMHVEKGAIFGMIRIGSQVDLVVPSNGKISVRVKPGDRVRAGETILMD